MENLCRGCPLGGRDRAAGAAGRRARRRQSRLPAEGGGRHEGQAGGLGGGRAVCPQRAAGGTKARQVGRLKSELDLPGCWPRIDSGWGQSRRCRE